MITLSKEELEQGKNNQVTALTQGVHPMKVAKWEEKTSKTGNLYISCQVYTGFKTADGKGRFFYLAFQKTPQGLGILADFLKRGFSEELTNEAFEKTVNKEFSVATQKTGEYIEFWYCGLIKDLEAMRKNYVRKSTPQGGYVGAIPEAHEEEKQNQQPINTMPNVEFKEPGF